jgi:hypothetical protein
VGDERFKLSKNLLCYHSTFFYKIFNGNFKEGIGQTITLETRAANFQMVIQWMHTSAISLPTSTVVESKRKISHRFSSFLFLPINRLLGPFDSVIASTKAILVIDHQHFLAEHVRTAFASSESSTRKLFAQSCLGPCLSYIHPGEGYTRSLFSSVQKEFPFEKDLKESDEFAPDLV